MIKRLRITINGEPFEVEAEVLNEAATPPSASVAPSLLSPSAPVAETVLATAPRAAATSGRGRVASPMSGKLVSYAVAIGDQVSVGDELATVEAMKMNTYVYAESRGKVHELLARPGDGVEEGQAIMIVK